MPSVSSTTKKLSLSVLLPTYNEHENLPIICYLLSKYLKQSAEYVEEWEVIVIDDASPDGTGEVADRLASPRSNAGLFKDGQLRVLKRSGKQGLGSAYMHGITFAKHPYILILDADLSHHPRDLQKMLQSMAVANPDIVTGSRYISGGGVEGWDLKRRVVSRGANFLADFLLDPQCSDLTGSYRLYRKTVLEKLIKTTATKGYTFQMEIMVRARSAGYKIREVPITFVDRQFEESKLGSNEIFGYLKGLWTLFTTV